MNSKQQEEFLPKDTRIAMCRRIDPFRRHFYFRINSYKQLQHQEKQKHSIYKNIRNFSKVIFYPLLGWTGFTYMISPFLETTKIPGVFFVFSTITLAADHTSDFLRIKSSEQIESYTKKISKYDARYKCYTGMRNEITNLVNSDKHDLENRISKLEIDYSNKNLEDKADPETQKRWNALQTEHYRKWGLD